MPITEAEGTDVVVVSWVAVDTVRYHCGVHDPRRRFESLFPDGKGIRWVGGCVLK